MGNLKRFLLYFAQENVSFRHPEIRSLVKFFNLNIQLPSEDDKPYWILEACEKDLRKIASRSVSLRFVSEVWCSGKGYDAFHHEMRNFPINKQPESAESLSFRVTVESYNKRFSHTEKVEKIDTLSYIQLKGRIDLKNPDTNFVYFEFWGIDPLKVPDEPEEIVFGPWVWFLQDLKF